MVVLWSSGGGGFGGKKNGGVVMFYPVFIIEVDWASGMDWSWATSEEGSGLVMGVGFVYWVVIII